MPPYDQNAKGETESSPTIPDSSQETDLPSQQNNEFDNLSKQCEDTKQSKIRSDAGLSVDPHFTGEQHNRDVLITKLLEAYYENYRGKSEKNFKYRTGLFAVCLCSFVVLMIISAIAIITSFKKSNLTVSDAVALATACGSVIASSSFLLKIVAKYIFPRDEEQHITEIVKAIQENDLKHKVANIEFENKASERVQEKELLDKKITLQKENKSKDVKKDDMNHIIKFIISKSDEQN